MNATPATEWPPEAGLVEAGPVGKPLSALRRREQDPETELIKNGYLCRGGGLLLCGPTGIGKSALSIQAMIQWALGLPLFGITPSRPLRSLLVQAENDEGDLAEMRDGVIAGMELSTENVELALADVIAYREDGLTSQRFFDDTVAPLLREHKPDLLWLDPALSYLGGDAGSQAAVGPFLRNMLNPLLREHGCASVVVHHTNKPPSGKEKPQWAGPDFAYLGSGSAEWANWARAVLALRSIGQRGVFELQAGKRGSRIGWKDSDGSPAFMRHIAHSTRGICWREAEPDEVNTGGRPAKATVNDLLALLPRTGLTTAEWETKAKDREGIGRSLFFRLKRELQQTDRVHLSEVTERWQPVTKRQ